MSSKLTIEKNTEAQVNAVNIKTLSDRPNVVSRYGDGGLSATQLKERFDGFPALNREKINQIIDALNGAESTKYLGIGTDALSEFGVDNLYDLLVKMTTSDIAGVLKVDYMMADDAQAVAYTLQEAISDIMLVNSNQHSAIMGNANEIAAVKGKAEKEYVNIASAFNTHNGRISALEKDNTTNKSNISNHGGRIEALESWKEPTNAQIIKNVNSLVDHLDRIEVLESDNTTNKNRISTLETDNTINKSNIRGHSERINKLETAYQALTSVDDTVKANITTIDEKLTEALKEATKISDTVDAHIKDADERIEAVESDLGEVLQDGKKISINSIVIGEGEAADLSIAGGTKDIDTYGEKAGLSTTEILALKAALVSSGGIGLDGKVKLSKATAPMSIALGANNESTSSGAIALGYGNKNSGFNSTAIGAMNTVSGDSAFAYGYKNTVKGDFGAAFGQENTAGEMALAGGVLSKATGKGSISFGNENVASGEYAVALGGDNTASGKRSVALGNENEASGECSFAEGTNTTASGKYSHAQNEETTASGESSTAEGYKTLASGNQAHAGGRETVASARNSTAFGFKTEANHEQSFTSGRNLITGRENQTVVGEWNEIDENALYVVGNGNGPEDRRNAFTVNKDGTAYLNGKQILTKTAWNTVYDDGNGYIFFDPTVTSDYEFYAQFTITDNGPIYKIMLGNLQFNQPASADIIIGNPTPPIEGYNFYLKYETTTKRLKIVYSSSTGTGPLNRFYLQYRLVHE